MNDRTQPVGTPDVALDDEPTLEDFYEHALHGHLSILRDGTVVRVNSTFLAWTGLERDALLAGTRFASLLSVGGRVLFETHCMPMLLAGETVEQVSVDLRQADGPAIPVLLEAHVHAREADGTPAVIRVVLVDISQRRRFEDDLVRTNDELSRSNEEYDIFAHAAAHDLREPLRGIHQHTEFFLEDAADTLAEEDAAQLQTVLRLADRMRGMLDDLLAYAETGREAWEPRTLQLTAAVAEVREMLGARAVDATITVTDATYVADEAGLRQILLNLVGNAIKYSGGPAVVAVETCTLQEASLVSELPPAARGLPSDTPVLTVSDQGIGISADHQDRIFTLFRQLDKRADGSGTGLALCRLICRRQRGDVWVSSAPGEGSTFFVVAPG